MEQHLENLGAWIPQIISSRTDITPAAKLVYSYIDGWTRNGRDCYASNATIGEWCGICERTVRESISQMIDIGLISASYDANSTRHLQSTELNRNRVNNIPVAENAGGGGKICQGGVAKSATYNIIDNIKDKCTTYTAAAEKPRAASAWLPPGIRDGLVAIGLTKDSIDLVARNFGALKRIWTSYPKGRRRRFADLAAGFCRAVELGAAMELDIPAMEAWLKQASAEETKYLPAIDVWAEGAGWKPTKATTKALVDRPFRPHAANDTWGNQCNTYRQSGASEKEIEYIRQRSGWFARYREASGATPAEIVEKARAELASRVSVSSEMLKV